MSSELHRASFNKGPSSWASEQIKERPDEAILLALASGAIVGLALGSILASNGSRTRQQQHIAAGLGERLLNSLDKVIPDSLSRGLGINQ